MNKRINFILVILSLSFSTRSQDCAANYEAANRAYVNGNFAEADLLIRECLDEDMSSSTKVQLLYLAIKNSLMLDQTETADLHMNKLLQIDPYFELAAVDPVMIRNLHESYLIRPIWSLGLSLGISAPDFQILQYQSYGGETNEPSDYQDFASPTVGVSGWRQIHRNGFLDLGFFYRNCVFRQEEIILNYHKISSREKLNYLNMPMQLRLQTAKPRFNLFVSGGMSLNLLLKATADINHFAIATEFPQAFPGLPESVTNFDLSKQRTSLSQNYVGTIGANTRLGNEFLLEISASFEKGLVNLVEEKYRYGYEDLINKYAYVPDDFSMNTSCILVSVKKVWDKPRKKK